MESSISSRNDSSSRGVAKDNLTDSKTLALHPSVIGISAVFALYVFFLVIYYMVFSRRKKHTKTKLKLSAAPVDEILSDNWLNNGSSSQHGKEGTFSAGYQNMVTVLDSKSLPCDRKIASLSDIGDAAHSWNAANSGLGHSVKVHRCKSASVFQREYSRERRKPSGGSPDPQSDTTAVVFTLGPGLDSFCSQITEPEGLVPCSPTISERYSLVEEGPGINRCSSSKSSIARTPSYRKACTSQSSPLHNT